MLSVTMLSVIYAEFKPFMLIEYAEMSFMLSVVILSVANKPFMLSVIIMNVIMLRVINAEYH